MKIWAVQLVLNFLWSPTFFGAKMMGLALVVIALLLASIGLFIATAWQVRSEGRAGGTVATGAGLAARYRGQPLLGV